MLFARAREIVFSHAREVASPSFPFAFYGENAFRRTREVFERDLCAQSREACAHSTITLTRLFIFSHFLRLKNTSMPTQDMERFVELSHREEELDDEDVENENNNNENNNNDDTMNNNNSVGGSFETTTEKNRRMMEHSKSHPRMLKSAFLLLSFENFHPSRARGNATSLLNREERTHKVHIRAD